MADRVEARTDPESGPSRHAIAFDIDGTLLRSPEVDDALYRQAVHSILGDVRIRPSLMDYAYVMDLGVLAQILADQQ